MLEVELRFALCEANEHEEFSTACITVDYGLPPLISCPSSVAMSLASLLRLVVHELDGSVYFDPQDHTAKLADFGLAKDGPQGDNTHVTTRVMGTHGYAAPEYVLTGKTSSISNSVS